VAVVRRPRGKPRRVKESSPANRLTVGEDAQTLRYDREIRWFWQPDCLSDRSVEHIETRTAAAQRCQIPVGHRANTTPLRAKVMFG